MAIYPRMLIGLVLILSIFNWSQGQPLRDGFGNKLGLDFIAFYIAGRSVLEDSGQNLYDLEWQRSTQQKVLNYDQTSFTPFINPPYATAIYALFSHDSYRLSYGLWVLTSFLLLLLSCTLLARNLLNRSRQSAFRFIYFSLAFFPTYLWFFYGQATGFLLLILSAAFVLLRQGKDFRAGFVLGLLAFKPQIALCLLLPIIIKRRYRAMAGGLFALSLWAIIAYCFFYQQMIEFWAFKAVLPAILVNEGYPTWGITSLYGFSQLLIGGFSINAANILCLFLSAIALFVIFGHWKNEPWKPASMQWDLSMAGTFAFSLLAGVHLFSYDLTLLLIPFFIVYAAFSQQKHSRLDSADILAFTVAIYCLALFGPYLSSVQLYLTCTESFQGMALQLITLMIVGWGLAVIKYARNMRTSSELISKLNTPLQASAA